MCTVMNNATVAALGLATISLAAPPQVD